METTGKQTGRRRKVLRWIGIVAAVLVCVRLVPLLWNLGWHHFSDAPRVTISTETTYVTGPLRDDGYVDYFAALNEIGSEGVDAQNNAAVPLIAVLGCPECGSEAIKQKLYELLEIEPEQGETRYRELGDFFDEDTLDASPDAESQDPWDQQTTAARRPWDVEEFPIVYEWISANQLAIDKIVAATDRTRYHVPLLANEEDRSILAGLMPSLSSNRSAGRSLATRAMLRVTKGDLDGAQDDLLACHRLGRLVGQAPTLIDCLVGIAIDGIASEADVAMAHAGKMDASQIDAYRSQLRQLPPARPVREKLVAERFMCLDLVCGMARGESFGDGVTGSASTSAGVDFDVVLTTCNEMYDRLQKICDDVDRERRARASDAFDVELAIRSQEARSPLSMIKQFVFGSRTTAARNMADLMCALLMPAVGSVFDAEDRQVMTIDMVDTALALAAFRLDEGSYPESLEALVPKYRDAVPKDVFSDGAVRYLLDGEGYVLYSVGPDGEDNGGIVDGGPDSDFGFRMPVSDEAAVN